MDQEYVHNWPFDTNYWQSTAAVASLSWKQNRILIDNFLKVLSRQFCLNSNLILLNTFCGHLHCCLKNLHALIFTFHFLENPNQLFTPKKLRVTMTTYNDEETHHQMWQMTKPFFKPWFTDKVKFSKCLEQFISTAFIWHLKMLFIAKDNKF